MRLIDADELRRALAEDPFPVSEVWEMHIDAAPTVDVPQPLTRDGVLAEVARIEAAGDAAVVEILWTTDGEWSELSSSMSTAIAWVKRWDNPDVPRWNMRVRAVEVETEDVPLTQLVGRTIKDETEAVKGWSPANPPGSYVWWPSSGRNRIFPVDLATGLVTVVKGEA